MKFLTYWALVFLTVLQPLTGFAALTDFDRQEIPFENLLAKYNSGFESGKANWTASGGTLAAVTSGTNLLAGKGSATWDASASGQTLTSQAITIPKGYYGLDCEVEILAQVPSGTATHYVRAYDGTNVQAYQAIISSTTPRWNPVTFPCPQSGTIALQIYANADEPLIAVDVGYIGRSKRVGSTQLTSEETSWTPTGSWTSNSTYNGKKRRNGDRMEYQVNIALAGAPTSAGLTITLPSSDVIDTLKLATGTNGYILPVNGGEANGTSRVPLYVLYNSTTSVKIYAGVADQSYLQTGNQVTQAVPFTWANGHNLNVYFSLPIVGLTAQTIVMPDAQGWYVDASISGANVGLGTTSVSSYSVIGSSSLSMTKASGSADVQVPCSGGNAPSGLTCSAGSELFGVAFNIPKSGAYRVCASANHYIDSPAGSINLATTFQLAETSTTSDTILQEGKGKAMSGSILMSGDRREYRSVYTCGNFVFSSVGQKVVKLMYETEISGTPDNHYIKADGDTILGQPDVHITVWPLSQQQQAILANSVTTTVTNGVKILTAKIQAINGSTCTVSEEDGDWLGATTPIATGRCTVAINAGVFSVSPKCFLTPYPTTYTGATQQATGHLSGVSTSAITVEVRYQAASGSVGADDSPTMLMCVGGR